MLSENYDNYMVILWIIICIITWGFIIRITPPINKNQGIGKK